MIRMVPPAKEGTSSTTSPPSTLRRAEDDDDMFSPTSAAALALSTLHHYGAHRDSRRPELRGTRLFNNTSNPSGTGHRTSPSYPTSQYHSYHDRRYHGDRYDRWSDRTREPSAHPPPASWVVPPYASRYPPHSQESTYSMEGAPDRGSTPTTVRPSPSSQEYYTEEQNSTCTYNSHYHAHHGHPLGSPPGYVGPSPPLSSTNSFHPSASINQSTDKAYARLASSTTMVTPTPKKVKVECPTQYSRKKKSLGVLAENFLKTYEGLPQGSTIVVDEAAVKLGVERRRIYDVVNILESICLVCKKHKNTYSWMGMSHLDAVFGRLQAQAIAEYPEDAEEHFGSKDSKNCLSPIPLKPPRRQSKTKENKSLAKLSQEFLQVFLVGYETLSLPEASDKIQGATSHDELVAMGNNAPATPQDPKEVKAAAARGLKTKIRRLYDIANVFLSVGLLKKVESTDSSRRPNFSWVYRLSAKQLYDLHRPTKSERETPTACITQSQDDDTSRTETYVSSAASSPDMSTGKENSVFLQTETKISSATPSPGKPVKVEPPLPEGRTEHSPATSSSESLLI